MKLYQVLFQPQWYETRNQQEESWKIYKYLEIKQYLPEKPTSQGRNQKVNLRNLGTNENGKTY